MAYDLQNALDAVGMTYTDLVSISDDIVQRFTRDLDSVINNISDFSAMTNEQVRDLALKLSIKAYSIGEMKEHSSLKSECAKTLMKEKQASETLKAEGTVDTKKNKGLLQSSEEILVDLVYEQVANQISIKYNELHRIVDTLKSNLISRQAEAKLSMTVGE